MMMFGGHSMVIIANFIAAFHTRQERNMSGLSGGLVTLSLFVALYICFANPLLTDLVVLDEILPVCRLQKAKKCLPFVA
jgi:hypothetical protein